MKDYFKKLIAKRQGELTKLRDALVASDNAEERKSINESVLAVEEEIRDAEAQLANLDLPANVQNPTGELRRMGGMPQDGRHEER